MTQIPIIGQGFFKMAEVGKARKKILRHPAVTLMNASGRTEAVFIERKEIPVAVVQHEDDAYLVTRQVFPVDGDMKKYMFTSRNVINEIPYMLAEISTTCGTPIPIFNNIYDGTQNIPAAVFKIPEQFLGIRQTFANHYSNVFSHDLRDGTLKGPNMSGSQLGYIPLGDKGLVSIVLPATKVGEMVASGVDGALKEAFMPEDLEMIPLINARYSREHEINIFGIIAPDQFELVKPRGYPRYEVAVDLEGKVYEAKRLAPEKRN